MALLILPMVLGCLIYGSWLRCQEGYTDPSGRYALRYSERDCLWKRMDYATFRFLNGTMADNRPMQILWGLTNHRACDLAAALWMIFVFLGYYLVNPRKESRIELLQFGLYMSIATLIVITVSGAKIGIDFRRYSPTLTDGLKEHAVLLSQLEHITWKLKDVASRSFPGDHGVVLLLIGSFLLYRLHSVPARMLTVIGGVFFSLPRLAGGAHWLSDLLAGSLLYYALTFPVFMFAPVRERGLRILRLPAFLIYRVLTFLSGKNPTERMPPAESADRS